MSRQVDRAALMEFVLKRRKSTGGYGATPRLPATIEDTFQAVAIGLVLGEESLGPASDSALAVYLARMLAAPWLGIGTTFRLLTACRVCGLAADGERVRSHLAACLAGDASLAAGYYVGRITRDILDADPAALGFGRPAVLPARYAVEDAARYLAVKTEAGERIEAEELRAWLTRSQNGDGGFGFFPNTTSFIENCHAALAGLRLLQARPLALANARDFILSCQTRRGGFARSPKAAPFLDASWHAIACLRLLEEMEHQQVAGGKSENSGLSNSLVFSV